VDDLVDTFSSRTHRIAPVLAQSGKLGPPPLGARDSRYDDWSSHSAGTSFVPPRQLLPLTARWNHGSGRFA
jgi:hypothetical protein